MRIVHVMNWYIPKLGYQENHLPAEQKKLGHDVEIIASDRFPAYKGFKQHIGKIHVNRIVGAGIFNENDVKIYRLPCFWEVKNSKEILLKGLKKKLKELKPDIVQAHGAFCPLTLQTILYSKKLGYKIFVDDHSHETNFHLNSLSKKVYMEMLKLFFRVYGGRVCCFMPINYAAKQILQSVLSIPNEKIELFYLGANTDRFKKSIGLREKKRKEIDIDTNEVLIISTGKFSEKKDIPFLIEAFKKTVKKCPNTKLLLVGNGPNDYMQKLKGLIGIFELNEKIIFHDFVPNSELPKYYNAADIGVWPGNPSITVIEAVATGLPVIVPSSDLAYTLLFKNKAAVGFERGNVSDLSKKLHALIQNRETLREMNTHALKVTKQELSWKVIAKKSIEMYKNAI